MQDAKGPPVSRELLILAEQVRAIYRSFGVIAVVPPLAAVLMTIAFSSRIGDDIRLSGLDVRRAWLWVGLVIIASTIASAILYAAFRRQNALPHDASRWLKFAAARHFAAGIAWGSSGVLLFVPNSPVYQALLVAFLIAFGSAAMSVTANHPWIYRAWCIPLFIPYIVREVFEGGRMSTLLAVVAGLSLVFLLAMTRNLSKHIVESLTNRFANVELLEQLELQKGGAEQARDQAELERRRAEEASRAKSRFLAAASHDLRQPIHALGLFTSAVREHVSSDQGQRIVDKIASSVDAMEMMFNALLDISRLDAGILEPRIKNVALGPMLARLAAEYAPNAEANGLRLRVRPCAHSVRSDLALLERVLRNFLSNAIRYTLRGGVLVGCRKRSAAIAIEVWDTGVGMPQDKLGDVFKEFYQVGNPERDRAKGLGLGLAIVKRIGALLRHPIKVTSRVGKGSRFSIEAPLGEESQEELIFTGQPADSAALIGAFVVVIDDEGDVREAVEILLRQWGCHVLAADSREQALQMLRRHDRMPDAILCDYRLREGETGIGAIEAIQQEWGLAPAALITGDTAPDRLREATASGHQLLHKPLNPRLLKTVLCAMLTSAKTAA
jgi:two-component system, sensor histidine kinase